MENINQIKKALQCFPQKIKIILPEGTNTKIQQAALAVRAFQIEPLLVFAKASHVNQFVLDHQLPYIVVATTDQTAMAQYLHALRQEKCSWKQATFLVAKRNYFSTILLKQKKVDGLVGGIEYSTKDIILPALQIIKCKPGVSTVASYFFMVNDNHQFIVGDCALNVDPTALQLSVIAKTAYEMSRVFHMTNPQIAFLSYSTYGSGTGPSVDKVQTACQILKDEGWNKCVFDGELQLDSAVSATVRKMKAPHSPLQGVANILIFPDINAGNIGYKLLQRLGGYDVVGPILMGTAQPVNDLSRGASVAEIINNIVITGYMHVLNLQK